MRVCRTPAGRCPPTSSGGSLLSTTWRRWRWASSFMKYRVRPTFDRETHLDAHVRERAEELTLRADEAAFQKTFMDVSSIKDDMWSPPLINVGWYSSCRALCDGIHAVEWSCVYQKYKSLKQELWIVSKGRGERDKAFWRLCERKARNGSSNLTWRTC